LTNFPAKGIFTFVLTIVQFVMGEPFPVAAPRTLAASISRLGPPFITPSPVISPLRVLPQRGFYENEPTLASLPRRGFDDPPLCFGWRILRLPPSATLRSVAYFSRSQERFVSLLQHEQFVGLLWQRFARRQGASPSPTQFF